MKTLETDDAAAGNKPFRFPRVSRKAAAGAAASPVMTCAGAGFRFLMLAVLARVMPVEEYGRFVFAFSLAIVLLLVGDYRKSKLVLRFFSHYLATGDMESGTAWPVRCTSIHRQLPWEKFQCTGYAELVYPVRRFRVKLRIRSKNILCHATGFIGHC